MDLQGAERPNVLKVSDSLEVSRSHLEIVLEGWLVMVRDLGSSNGTILTLPGKPPERLRDGQLYQLEAMAEISLGDVVAVRFEVTE